MKVLRYIGLGFLALVAFVVISIWRIPPLNVPRCMVYPPAQAHARILARGKALYKTGDYVETIRYLRPFVHGFLDEPRKNRPDLIVRDGFSLIEPYISEHFERKGDFRAAAQAEIDEYSALADIYRQMTCAPLLIERKPGR